MTGKKRGLGRGLDSFVMEAPAIQDLIEAPGGRLEEVDVDMIKSNPLQPRKEFDPQALEELAESIKEVGVLQPLIVRKKDQGYLLVAGERRLRASIQAGLDRVPVLVADIDQEEADRIALIENIQREDLDPLEEAQAYASLKEGYDYTQEDLAQALGKSRSYIANRLRLLNLSDPVKDLLKEGQLSASHARLLLTIADPDLQYQKALDIIKSKTPVKEAEKKLGRKKAQPARDPYISDLEDQLMDRLGTKVSLEKKGKKGTLTIDYYSDHDLQRILDLILGGDLN